LRGGSWYNNAQYVRSACRDGYHPGIPSTRFGFRVVRGGAVEDKEIETNGTLGWVWEPETNDNFLL
jgi:hypothetical protein